jgi:hypothetical protein
MVTMPRHRSPLFKISINGVEWDEPFPQFSNKDAAIGYVAGVMGRLLDMGAPSKTTVSVKQGRRIVSIYSVASWRLAVMTIGDKAYTPRPGTEEDGSD